ncbi:MAG: hypothetical protein ACOC93_05935, partial [Planctomycetota bacterium]
AWTASAVQTCALDDVGDSRLGKAWYDRKVGVQVQMLDAPTGEGYAARTPRPVQKYRDEEGNQKFRESNPETGGVTFVATQTGTDGTFEALHVPFENGQAPKITFRRAASKENAAMYVIDNEEADIRDRVLIAWGDAADEPVTLSADGKSYTFRGWGLVRETADGTQQDGQIVRIDGE